MLNLYDLLWVIPGAIFIYSIKRKKPTGAITVSGWPYVFFIVIIGAFTWLPAEWITENLIVPYTPINTIFSKIVVSLFFVSILLIVANHRLFANWIFSPIHDHFYKKCIRCRNETVILTLKNQKAYIGTLWRYPEDPKSRHESQTISIIPMTSGFRDEKTKKIVWNTDYPEHEEAQDFIDMEKIIPRNEILTFGKFSEKTFEHFSRIQEEK